MHTTLWRATKWVFSDEGGFVVRSAEPGGAGNFGVSFEVFERWRKVQGQRNPMIIDLKAMTEDEARAIYDAYFWVERASADDLQLGVDYCVFDTAIQPAGVNAAAMLSEVLDLQVSQKMTPALVAAANAADAVGLINKLCDRWLVRKKKRDEWPRFGKGWTARVEKRRTRSLSLVGGLTWPIRD